MSKELNEEQNASVGMTVGIIEVRCLQKLDAEEWFTTEDPSPNFFSPFISNFILFLSLLVNSWVHTGSDIATIQLC